MRLVSFWGTDGLLKKPKHGHILKLLLHLLIRRATLHASHLLQLLYLQSAACRLSQSKLVPQSWREKHISQSEAPTSCGGDTILPLHRSRATLRNCCKHYLVADLVQLCAAEKPRLSDLLASASFREA